MGEHFAVGHVSLLLVASFLTACSPASGFVGTFNGEATEVLSSDMGQANGPRHQTAQITGTSADGYTLSVGDCALPLEVSDEASAAPVSGSICRRFTTEIRVVSGEIRLRGNDLHIALSGISPNQVQYQWAFEFDGILVER